MKLKHLVGFAAALTVGIAPVASAQENVSSISSFTALFKNLDGMTVSWTTADGCPTNDCTGTWEHISGSTWGVVSNGNSSFSLTANGNSDTYGLGPLGYEWNLSGKNITGFSMDATTANAVFDILSFPEGTQGSSLGNSFSISGCYFFFCLLGDEWNTTATYSNVIGVNDQPPVGDLYGMLDVSFGKNFGSNKSGEAYALFTQDADLTSGDFSVPQEATPEPGAMTMMATGLVGLAGLARRRRKR